MTRLAPFPTWFDRVASDVFGPGLTPAAAVSRGPNTSARTTPEALELRVELPGFSEADIDVTIDGRVLTIAAARAEGEARQTTTRKVSVGEGYDLDAVSAAYRHGLLTVTVPAARPASRKVAISVTVEPELPAPAASHEGDAPTA